MFIDFSDIFLQVTKKRGYPQGLPSNYFQTPVIPDETFYFFVKEIAFLQALNGFTKVSLPKRQRYE